MARTPQQLADDTAAKLKAIEANIDEALQIDGITPPQIAKVQQMKKAASNFHAKLERLAKEIPDVSIFLGGK